nr:1397_t:CDS:2 [Entrophospora candida]
MFVGSMTGAPKLHNVQLLEKGGVPISVLSLEQCAGGAIIDLSNPEMGWQEILLKLQYNKV